MTVSATAMPGTAPPPAKPAVIARSITPEWLLSTLEEFHRDGWDVCGYQLVPGSRRGEMGLWVTYRRTRPDA